MLEGCVISCSISSLKMQHEVCSSLFIPGVFQNRTWAPNGNWALKPATEKRPSVLLFKSVLEPRYRVYEAELASRVKRRMRPSLRTIMCPKSPIIWCVKCARRTTQVRERGRGRSQMTSANAPSPLAVPNSRNLPSSSPPHCWHHLWMAPKASLLRNLHAFRNFTA